MASVALADVNHGVTVGRVFGRSVDVIRANPLATFGTSFALMALPQLLLQQIGVGAALFQNFRQGLYAAALGYVLVVGLLWLIASGALVQATVAHDEGRPADPVDMVRTGILRCLPLVAVYLVMTLGVWFGMLLFFVPGIMLGVMWSVALPAIIAERPGVFGALSRSRALTKGARWQVFGILLLAVVIYLLVSMTVGVATVASYGSFAAITTQVVPPTPSLFGQLLQSLVTTVTITWLTTVGASLFIELRHWKDGPDADQVADIFA